MRRRTVASVLVALVAAGLLFVVEPARGDVEGGGSGIVHSTATTITVPDGEFEGLEVTVSQTTDLANQAVVITWTGATPTPRTRALATDYFQIMQCWGDPDASGDPKGLKLRETCQFGAELAPPQLPIGGGNSNSVGSNTRNRYGDYGEGYPAQDEDEELPPDAQAVPFQPIGGQPTPDGSAGNQFPLIKDPVNPNTERRQYPVESLAPYYTPTSTNEVPFALSTGAGTGRAVFEVQNAALAPHLGCGAGYTDAAGNVQPPPKCSLVIVPRGHLNPYTGEEAAAVHGSPFDPALWKNRIVVPLDFDPVGSPCSLTKAETPTTGTELIQEAMTSWQPTLCADNGPIYGYTGISDFEVGRRVVSTASGSPGLGFTPDPVVTSALDPAVLHAPVAVSAPVIALNVDANLRDPIEGPVPADLDVLRGLGLSDVKLTPRLVAKMLTYSYTSDIASADPPEALAKNYHSVRFDPEFIDLNPTFAYWNSRRADTLNGLMVTVGSSVAARSVWRWILADDAAKAWLAGTADENGMVVNPAYRNVLTTSTDTFPKLDPSCFTGPAPDYDHLLNCTFSYRPYMGTLREAAAQTLRADTKSSSGRMDHLSGTFDPTNPKWDPVPRQQPGSRLAMSITDSASAARYGLFAAQLCKATRGSDGRFAASDCRSPTTGAMAAAVGSAVDSQVTGVKVVDPARAWTTAGAYPLTTITYAVADTSETLEARRLYAKLLRYAVGSGQDPGPSDGQLPEGYAPLSTSLREQAMTAANQLENWVAPTTAAPTGDATGTPAPTTPPASVPASGAGPSPGFSPSTAPPPVAPAAQTTLGSPLGMIRFLLIAALVMGLVGGVAGPIMQRLAARTGRK